jgi:hypothetical protein
MSSKGALSAQMAKDELNVRVVASPVSDASNNAADRIQDLVEDSLVDSGYRIDRNLPDMLVTLKVDAELWDQTGPYYLFKGDCSTEAVRVYDEKTLGKGRFSEKGERIQDEEDALISLADKLGSKAAKWVVSNGTPEKLGISAVDLAVEHSWYNFFKKQPEFVADFITNVEKIDGVVSCRLAGDDRHAKVRTFRVVYVEDKIPEGLLHRIASIDDLNITIAK